MKSYLRYFLVALAAVFYLTAAAQELGWTADGASQIIKKEGNIYKYDPRTDKETLIFDNKVLTPQGSNTLKVQSLTYSADGRNTLIFANTARVWRKNTRGDYWLHNSTTGKISKVGSTLPSQSLMFAKFSPDGKKIAYVSGHNLYVEDVGSGISKRLTSDGTRKIINGTFDWVYEEEFGCRDGFRWSPDSRELAFWRVDATKIGEYDMLNTTDSNYSRIIPVEYPKVGTPPSPVKIGVVNVQNGNTRWMNFEGDPQQHYIPRMEWSGVGELIVQRLDRKQQESKLIYCRTADGSSSTFWADDDKAWVDLNQTDIFGEPGGFNFINKGQDFLWISEKDGWRHIYKISRDGKTASLLTTGNYDVASILQIPEDQGYVYFMASPNNPTQSYLYRVKISKPGEPELVSPAGQQGVHTYQFSPNGRYALHKFSNRNTPTQEEWVSLPDHKRLSGKPTTPSTNSRIEYLQLKTRDNAMLDAWIHYPNNFDANKKYPIVFTVYGEPAASTVMDEFGNHENFLYAGDMANDGYIYAAVDNRGTPMLKGREWRKSIYRKIGVLNIDDMADGAKQIVAMPFVDKDRVAVWGWSGGGASTLNLMFKYPDLFKTGIAIAAVTNQLFYDNIYQERYMGLPQENMEDFIKGSPAFNVQGLKGKLLYVHGTGDDNVHYSNAEYLINELVKHGKQFQMMAYPNRSHGIREGEGTTKHLSTLYTNFLRENCPPGAR